MSALDELREWIRSPLEELEKNFTAHRDGHREFRVAQQCRFEDPAREHQICQFTIDLYGFFDDRQMQNMTIGGAVTKNSLEVFHAGRHR